MDYDDLCEYVQDNSFDEDEEEYNDEDDDTGDLTLEQVEDCFEEVDQDVVALFENRRSLKKTEFCLMEDGCFLSLFKMDKLTYIIREFFSNEKESESMDGKSFVITGKLQYFDNRDAMVAFIEENGGHVAGGVSKKTDFLVCNDGNATSSKAKKAAELGIPVITEGEFIGRFGFPDNFDLDEEKEDE